MPLEIVRVGAAALDAFYREHEREALKTLYDFAVVWHEQSHDFAAIEGGVAVGAATIRIAASLAHVERVIVDPTHRRRGIGRQLLERAEEVANYYNCHKMTAMLPHLGSAQQFFECCAYKIEAVLPQHSFKRDTVVLRKFLL